MTVHGALLDVHAVGVLLLGPSGVGKSECALELVTRGHRLVADDVVELERDPSGRLLGRAPERVRHYMEIRGLGLICIPDLFGPDSVRDEMSVDLVCHLVPWRPETEVERVGLERPCDEIEGVRVARLTLPARPGAGMATIVEVAARDQRQRQAGVNAAQRLDARVRGEMGGA